MKKNMFWGVSEDTLTEHLFTGAFFLVPSLGILGTAETAEIIDDRAPAAASKNQYPVQFQ
ncbi:MAG: hypothetical protein ABSH47_22845 [Bryobacteraceae bacterium]